MKTYPVASGSSVFTTKPIGHDVCKNCRNSNTQNFNGISWTNETEKLWNCGWVKCPVKSKDNQHTDTNRSAGVPSYCLFPDEHGDGV